MRVISGSARGINLQAPTGIQTRPTSDRVREALFSIIMSRFDLCGARVLDICAGTGALGIEALSRGASSCCFIENNDKALSALRNNLAVTKLTGMANVVDLEVVKALQKLGRSAFRFDIIFFDPPYSSNLYSIVPEDICRLSLLCSDGLFISECSARNVIPDKIGNLLKVDSRTYADTALNFYVLEDV